LAKGLAFDDRRFIPIPVFFENITVDSVEGPVDRASAVSIDLVNMAVVNRNLLVPRPFGPRLSRDLAEEVLGKVLSTVFGDGAPSVVLPDAGDFVFWVRPGESLTAVAMYFVRPALPPATARAVRADLIRRLRNLAAVEFDINHPDFDLTPLGSPVVAAVDQLKANILAGNIGGGVTPAVGGILENLTSVTGSGRTDQLFDEWMRIRIPRDTVDVLEAYMLSVLSPEGQNLHFISEFESLHAFFGEVHCGTNSIHRNPEADAAFTARWWDKGVYDPNYDTNYEY
jgi:hypothetical protein